MARFEVLVTYVASKDALRGGNATERASSVFVTACGPVEAMLVAAQMVAARGPLPIGAQLVL